MEQLHFIDETGAVEPEYNQEKYNDAVAEYVAKTDQGDAEYMTAPGVSLDLGVRATAAAVAMSYLNRQNRAQGLKTAAMNEKYRPQLNKRYRDPDLIVDMTQSAADARYSQLRLAVDQLTMSDELINEGFDKDDVDIASISIQHDITSKFGVGKANAADRAKKVSQLKKTAKNSRC